MDLISGYGSGSDSDSEHGPGEAPRAPKLYVRLAACLRPPTPAPALRHAYEAAHEWILMKASLAGRRAAPAGGTASQYSAPPSARPVGVPAPKSRAAARLQRMIASGKLPPQFPLAAVQEALSSAAAGGRRDSTPPPASPGRGRDPGAANEQETGATTRLSFLPPPKRDAGKSRKRPRAGPDAAAPHATAPAAPAPRGAAPSNTPVTPADIPSASGPAPSGTFFNLGAASARPAPGAAPAGTTRKASPPEGAGAPARSPAAAVGDAHALPSGVALHPGYGVPPPPPGASYGPTAPPPDLAHTAFPPAPEEEARPADAIAAGFPLSRREQRLLEAQLARGEVSASALPAVSHGDLRFDPRNAGSGMVRPPSPLARRRRPDLSPAQNRAVGPSVSRMAKTRHQLSSLLAHAQANADVIEEKNLQRMRKSKEKKKQYGWA